MAIPEYIELFDSGSGELSLNDDGTLSRDLQLRYLVGGKPGYLEAETWGKARSPLTYRGHRRKKLGCQALGNGWWIVTADYSNAAIQGEGGEDNQDNSGGDPVANTVAFDTTGHTEHITTALSTSEAGSSEGAFYEDFGAPYYAPMMGAINVDGDQVHGTDIVVPSFNFTETWTMPASWVLDTYIATLYELTGTVNKSRFRVFNEAECLFLGARGEMTRGQTMVAITYSFSARPTRQNFKVGSGAFAINVAIKYGWDYLWVKYAKSSVGATSGGLGNFNTFVAPVPAVVYIDKIYERKDFAKLSIGTSFPAVYQPRQSFSRITGAA